MTPTPTRLNGAAVDLGPRFRRSATVVASPAAAAETIVASVTLDSDVTAFTGVKLEALAAFLIGASGVSFNMRIRKTDVSGSILKASGVVPATAADLVAPALIAFDTSPTLPNQVYVVTLVIASGAAESTVSAVELQATII